MARDGTSARGRVFSIGHSSHTLETLLDLLRAHEVELVVDVRSAPYSRYAPHFARRTLEPSLSEAGITYLFLGRELGGRPGEDEFYDDQGRVLYWRVARTPAFQDGIEHLEQKVTGVRAAILCSEEDPTGCHRRLLVGRVLAERGIAVEHIRGDGRLVSEAELAAGETRARRSDDRQLDLFDGAETTWRSIRSVSRRRRRPSSSER